MFNIHEQKAYEILTKYRSQLDDTQYEDIKFVVANQVLEGLYPSEKNIQDLVDVATNKKTHKEVLQEILYRYDYAS
jgi:hypothetical protein